MNEPNQTTQTFIDPVCGKEVTPETAAASVEYGAQTYYFCSPGHRTVFETDPEKYITQSTSQSQS